MTSNALKKIIFNENILNFDTVFYFHESIHFSWISFEEFFIRCLLLKISLNPY